MRKNSVLIPRAQQEITACQQKLEAAETERKKHRAKLPASRTSCGSAISPISGRMKLEAA